MTVVAYRNKLVNRKQSQIQRVLLSRDRVLELDQGLPVLVVEAPSGYGKTVLAEMWLDRQRTKSSGAWVSLDASSRDPVVFLEQLMTAIGADYPGRLDSAIDGEAGRAERFAYFCFRLREAEADISLVIDNAHLLSDSPSQSYLEKLLELASASLRICLTLQPVKLEVGLGLLAAQSLASWIPPQSLALTREEIASFASLRGQALAPEQLEWLCQATEGWPAFVQLAMAMPPLSTSPSISVAKSGAVREYIYERFLGGLSPEDRDILWLLSCLGSAPISLLIALDPSPAKVELALLHFRSLGIVQNRDPDDSTAVFLHSLIREGALELLDRTRLRGRHELIREAAEWYWQNGLGPSAVRLALEEGPALQSVARDWLVSLSFTFIFRSGQHQTLLDLIDLWERTSRQTDPGIDVAAGWALTFQRQFNAALQRIHRLEASGLEGNKATALLQRAVLVCLRDDDIEGGVLSDQWIKQHQGSHSFEMGVASTVYAYSLKCAGDPEDALTALSESLHCFNLAQSTYGIGWTHLIGSLTLVHVGRYREALANVEGGLARFPWSQGFGSLRCQLRAIEAFLRYERNELASVREILGEVLGLLPEQAIVDAIGLGYTVAARLRAATGDFGTALDILAEGEQLGMQREYPRLVLILRVERALLLLRGGSTTQAQTIIQSVPDSRSMGTSLQLLRARLLLEEGNPEVALELLKALQAGLEKSFRQARLCEVMILIARAEDMRRNNTGAMAAIGEALGIGSTEGYVRCFLDEGKVVRSLVENWMPHSSAVCRPALALALANIVLGSSEGAEQKEPSKLASLKLNKREQQILGLLDEGLSNSQLAKRCIISESTVKWYLHNLYEKLHVGNRTSLLRVAREQGLTR